MVSKEKQLFFFTEWKELRLNCTNKMLNSVFFFLTMNYNYCKCNFSFI